MLLQLKIAPADVASEKQVFERYRRMVINFTKKFRRDDGARRRKRSVVVSSSSEDEEEDESDEEAEEPLDDPCPLIPNESTVEKQAGALQDSAPSGLEERLNAPAAASSEDLIATPQTFAQSPPCLDPMPTK